MIFANQPDPAQQQIAPTRLEVSPVYPMNRRGPMQPQAATSGGGGKGLGDMDIGKLIKMFQGKGAAAQSLMSGDPDPDAQYLAEAAMSGGGGGVTGGDGGMTVGDGGSAAAVPAAAASGLDTLGSLGDEALIGSYF